MIKKTFVTKKKRTLKEFKATPGNPLKLPGGLFQMFIVDDGGQVEKVKVRIFKTMGVAFEERYSNGKGCVYDLHAIGATPGEALEKSYLVFKAWRIREHYHRDNEVEEVYLKINRGIMYATNDSGYRVRAHTTKGIYHRQDEAIIESNRLINEDIAKKKEELSKLQTIIITNNKNLKIAKKCKLPPKVEGETTWKWLVDKTETAKAKAAETKKAKLAADKLRLEASKKNA